MKIKSLSGPCFAGPVSGVCLLSLLAVAVICPFQGGVRVNATDGGTAQNAQLTSEGSGALDAQNTGNSNGNGAANNNNEGIMPLADEGIETFAATSSLTVGTPSLTGSAEPGGTAYAKTNISYAASDIASWQLRTSYASGYSALKYEGTGGTTISGANGALTDNTWGYAWTDSTTAAQPTSYSTMPAYGSAASMKSGSGDVNTSGALHFAAKFAANATSGHYKTNVLVSLAATPKSIAYTLSFNANGGSSAPEPQTYSGPETSHTFTITSTKPTGVSGATFLGWAESASGNVAYQPGGSITLTSTSPTRTLYAKWQTGPAVQGFGGISRMQDMTSSICSSVANNTTGQLYDARDDSTYTVAKLADGKCWMTQNLRITQETIKAKDSSNTTGTVTSADTNTNSDYPIPASTTGAFDSSQSGSYYTNQQVLAATDNDYGAYYSYNVATLNKYWNASGGKADYDICPKGWRLPTGNTSGEFYKLAQTYPAGNLSGSSNTAGWTTNNGKNGRWLGAANATGGAFFPAAGYVATNGPGGAGSGGYYWSSTIANADGAYRLYFASNAINPASTSARCVGYSVRCVAQ